jgi:hypothetical protein
MGVQYSNEKRIPLSIYHLLVCHVRKLVLCVYHARWKIDADGGMDWTHLAQDRGQWSALVNSVMNLRVP